MTVDDEREYPAGRWPWARLAWAAVGYHQPGPVGSTVEVRYHAGLKRIWQVWT